MEHKFVTEAEVKVIVNEIVSGKFEELFEALNKMKGAMWAFSVIMGLINLLWLLHSFVKR